MPVLFHSEETAFNLSAESIFENWMHEVAREHGKVIEDINVIFSSNEYLLGLNKKFLNHNYFTDVITFNYSSGEIISGDIFVSIEQVKINAKDLKTNFDEELRRVIIHGLLHLIGFNDKNSDQKKEMREQENISLALFNAQSDGE